MTIALSGAFHPQSGGKATTLARLRRAGLPVPDGFVVPAEQPIASPAGCAVRGQIAQELSRLGDRVVAVRSSAADEDTAGASAAGLYESILGVRGTAEVCDAIAACRQSADAARVSQYRRRGGRADESATDISVLVQVLIAAEVSGVMFTPPATGGPTRVESSWGLGAALVGGALTPDAYEIGPGGDIAVVIGAKSTRTDPDSVYSGTRTTTVSNELQTERTLDDETLIRLAALGARVSDILGGAQDIEWAIADGAIWIVQSRPVTATLPTMPAAQALSGARACAPKPPEALIGAPGSHGIVTAHARIVSGPLVFGDVRPGEVVICPYTNPAWTPLFAMAAGVITEVGGTLSHAAIIAREYGIPAVLGVAEATTRIANGDLITIDGTVGTITLPGREQTTQLEEGRGE